jgi:hypothetical protein
MAVAIKGFHLGAILQGPCALLLLHGLFYLTLPGAEGAPSTTLQADPSDKAAEVSPLDKAKADFRKAQQGQKLYPQTTEEGVNLNTSGLTGSSTGFGSLDQLAQKQAVDPNKALAKDKNWLVEGALKAKTGSTSKRKPQKNLFEAESGNELSMSSSKSLEELHEQNEESNDSSEQVERRALGDDSRQGISMLDSSKSVQGTDPFQTYLKQWMRPDDYRLFSPGKSSQPPSSLPGSPIKPNGSQGEFGPLADKALPDALSQSSMELQRVGNLPKNPYLRDILPPASLLPRYSDDNVKPTSSNTKAIGSVLMEAPADKAKVVKEPYKPTEDKKYFPQLKRF